MSANHVEFAGAIQAMATGLGRAADPAAITRMNLVAQSLAEIDPETGLIAIRHASDRVEPFDEWMRREVGRWPAPIPEAPATTTGTGWTGQTAAAAKLVASTRARDAADAIAHARALASGPNPFRSGGNLTHRAIIAHHLPDVAAQLKAQA